jgi:hypothetical protein
MRFALGGTDAAVTIALGGVFSQKKLPELKIIMDDDFKLSVLPWKNETP